MGHCPISPVTDQRGRGWLGLRGQLAVAQGHPPESHPPPRERSCELGTSALAPPRWQVPALLPEARLPRALGTWKRGMRRITCLELL